MSEATKLTPELLAKMRADLMRDKAVDALDQSNTNNILVALLDELERLRAKCERLEAENAELREYKAMYQGLCK